MFHPYKCHFKLTDHDQSSKMTDLPSKITDPPFKMTEQFSKLSILKIIHSFNHLTLKTSNIIMLMLWSAKGKNFTLINVNPNWLTHHPKSLTHHPKWRIHPLKWLAYLANCLFNIAIKPRLKSLCHVICSHSGSFGCFFRPKFGILAISLTDISKSTQLPAQFGDPGTYWHHLRLFSGNSPRSK